jgi:5'-nucleotidase
VQAQVVDPVTAALEALSSTVVGTSEVALDLRLTPGVRTQETNAGNLAVDAVLWQARELADEFGVATPTVALLNSGGLRGETVFPAGGVTELMTFDIAPFASFVSVVEGVSPADLKSLLENAVSLVEVSDGRFAQVAGLSFTWDAERSPRTYDATGHVTSEGSRIRDVVLDDGTAVVRDGTVITWAPSVDVATIDFLARGGDQYPFGDGGFVTLGVTYQQALRDYIRDGLEGRITAAEYPEGGEGRISVE